MDSLTQIVLGIAVAEICAATELKNRTFLYGAILGTIPDLDVIIGMLLNPVDGVMIHRGISHSLFLFLFLSPFLGWLISKNEHYKITVIKATIMVFWCLFTHVLLDMFTSWGTQILWPLENRFALKTIFVIDPLYTIPLLLSLIFIWKAKNVLLRRKYVRRGLVISSSYLLLTAAVKLYTLNKFEKALQSQDITYSQIIVKPTAFNIILWNANVATDSQYLLSDYSLLDSQPISFTRYTKNNDLENRLKGNPDFEKLKTISEGWYLITKKNDVLYFNDLRFGLLNDSIKEPQFAFSYKFVDTSLGLRAIEETKENRDGKRLLKKIFKRLQGN
ncbi:metal-dependent hydrolase [Flavobacterium sp. 14A]|uniref:metal-dependent hydrolase n=1 Tax=Flavobacterium sp. 14A TaxID=2735896 RepID=UPI001570AC67|nr:metal-dependent hydrolase [Flavobacterium sp. 14A]NRT10471.1 inner membrane protein [Flavobacterium sp. 14A]